MRFVLRACKILRFFCQYIVSTTPTNSCAYRRCQLLGCACPLHRERLPPCSPWLRRQGHLPCARTLAPPARRAALRCRPTLLLPPRRCEPLPWLSGRGGGSSPGGCCPTPLLATAPPTAAWTAVRQHVRRGASLHHQQSLVKKGHTWRASFWLSRSLPQLGPLRCRSAKRCQCVSDCNELHPGWALRRLARADASRAGPARAAGDLLARGAVHPRCGGRAPAAGVEGSADASPLTPAF